MSPAAIQTAEFPIEGYAGALGSTAHGLAPFRKSHFDSRSSSPVGGRSLVTASGQPLSCGRQPGEGEAERQQTPSTPSSEYGDGPAAHCIEGARESLSPSADGEVGTSSILATANRSGDTPYAQLIYQALMSTPRRALKLQEIYQWFLENTDKGQPGQGKGWQNSIRHNLSMNGAFERRPIKNDASGGAEECSSPSGTSKQPTEWVLREEAILKGVESTTRYRNTKRRAQNKKLRGRSRADTASRRPRRRQVSGRPTVHPYPLPPPHFDMPGYQSHPYFGQFPQPFDTPADQLERLSLAPSARAVAGRDYEQRRSYYFTGGHDYEHAEYHPALPTLGGPMGTSMRSAYSSAPLSYSSEPLQPSPGAHTAESEDDVHEVTTPEPSFSLLEPAVLIPGDNSANHGPTSDPYSGASAYYSSATMPDSQVLSRYTVGDVVGVCDENLLRSCSWNGGNQQSHQ